MNQPTIDERLNPIVRELIANGISLEQAMHAFEKKCISVAMRETGGNVTRASKKLGVHRNTLHNKLRVLRTEEEVALSRTLLQRRRK